jgi:pimeloyl-ACP methyl ester carboxylesterase
VVLALHGWGRDHSDFASVLDDVPSIAVDLPGFGASKAPETVIGSAGYADRVAALLDLFDSPPLVVGHSFGGRVAVHLGARGLASGLLLVSAPLVRVHHRRRPPLGYRTVKALRFVLGPERLEHARRRYGSADYRAATGVMRDIFVSVVNEDYDDLLPRLAMPTRLVWGERDLEVPVAVGEAAAAVIPDARLRVVPGAGHHVLTTAPDAIRSEITEML